jgi:hypothetical protein
MEQINDDEGNPQTTQMGMLRVFETFMKEKYATKMTDVSAIHEIVQTIKARIAPEAHAELEQPITMEELKTAVKQGKQKKASGIDGICHEIFQKTWETTKDGLLTIMNTMYING